MTFNKLFITVLCIALPVSAWAGKSAFINSAIILQQSAPAVAAVKQMQDEFREREVSLRKLGEEIREKDSAYEKDKAIMSASKKKQVESEILELKRKLRFDAQSLKEDIDLRKKQTVLKLRATIQEVIKAYGKDKGYDFIFTEGVAYADDSVNITDEILEKLKDK